MSSKQSMTQVITQATIKAAKAALVALKEVTNPIENARKAQPTPS